MMTRLILVGGFLGAGKTTLLIETGRRLAKQGLRVGLVTNDQGEQLVDTALTADHDIPVTEVAGGCFCCRFPDLIKSLRKLQRSVQPDVILAEPVGSCTDLVATVLRPLHYYYGEHFTVAPLTVVVGADQDAAGFSTRVQYLHEKQAAEAEFILLNKTDLLTPAQASARVETLRARYPAAQVEPISARAGRGVEIWLAGVIDTPSCLQHALEIDYATYAAAEAELGWLNMRGTLLAPALFAPEAWITHMLEGISQGLRERQAPIAHLKMRLQAPQGIFKAGLTSATGPITWDSHTPNVRTDRAQFVLNLRAAGAPSLLAETVRAQVDEAGARGQLRCDIDHFECFRPAPPEPTYRLEQTP